MIDTVELGRRMMANAATLDDDTEFNQWARLAPVLISMDNRNDDGIKSLSPEEQQVVARAMNRLSNTQAKIA